MDPTKNEASHLGYWFTRLRDQEQCLFPCLNDGKTGSGTGHIRVVVPEFQNLQEFCQRHEIDIRTFFEVAWGLVLRSYTGRDDICFGFWHASTGLFPRDVKLVRESGLQYALDSFQTSFAEAISYCICPVEELETSLKVGPEGLFNTAIYYDDTRVSWGKETTMNAHTTKSDTTHAQREQKSNSRCIIKILVKVDSEKSSIELAYSKSEVSDGQAENISSAMAQVMASMLGGNSKTVGQQQLFSNLHKQRVAAWNENRPECVKMTLHAAVSTQVREQPDALAIDAWDEMWTFKELDVLSTQLARHLLELGMEAGSKVPLVFERSGWWVVSLLAVSKAGGAFVPVDPAQPILRLKEIMDDVKPTFLLSSQQCSHLLSDCVKKAIIVSRNTMLEINGNVSQSVLLPEISYKSVAYVMYTSGSTGRPKGAMLPHGGYLSALVRWIDGTNLGPGKRALQVSSYACDYSRTNELSDVFDQMRITWAVLSPSMIKTVQKESAKYLESLTLCGEPVAKEVVSRWISEKTKVWVAWAATECLAIARPDNFSPDSDVQNLGICKALCRVVEVGNYEQQVPIGAIGEIVVHSPWIADGYLSDPNRTTATFLNRPDWLEGVPSSYGSRWYRVGDLVRQNSDGSLVLAGRGDNMVKIRGQRFDMSEVERKLAMDDKIRNSLPLLPKVGLCKHRLVAVIALNDFTSTDADSEARLNLLSGSELQHAASWVSDFRNRLIETLPSYMMPSIWIMVKNVPLTVTGKIHRVLLKKLIENMDVSTYEEVSALGVVRQPPVSPMEGRLQKVWSDVLHLPLEKIGRNQTFISLGGDSILAMMVGARCNTEHLRVRAQDILKYGTISELAAHVTSTDKVLSQDSEFMSRYRELLGSIKDKLNQINKIDVSNVEDAYPCSPMQQGMLLSKARMTGEYNTSIVYEVQSSSIGSLSLENLQNAWQDVVNRHAVLRTFFIESVSQSGSFDQVVLHDYDVSQTVRILPEADIDKMEDIKQVFHESRPEPYADFVPPHNLTIFRTKRGRLFCRMNVEHTLVDGMSLSILLRDLRLAYDKNLPTKLAASYASYITELQKVVCSVDNKYWKAYLGGMHPCILPNLSYGLSRDPPKVEYRALTVDLKNSHHLLKFCQSQGVTLSALFRTTWALILRAFTGTDEVCFGFITSGRDLHIERIEETVGTFINMLVCRMELSETRSVKDLIDKAQSDYLDSLPHQHASLAQIQHVLGLYGQRLFNTSMTILKQVPLETEKTPSVEFNTIHEWSPNEYDMDVQVWVSNSSIKMELWYRTEHISAEHAENIGATFTQALNAITDDPDQRVGQLDLFSDYHRSQVWSWNAKMPETIDTCIHNLIERQVTERPNEVAIQSWDREMTFKELDNYAEKLAYHLVSLGVAPETHVLHCFEKSALAIVAILAILKAGGVCVSIDPSHPVQRLQTIIRDTRPVASLVSTLHRQLFNEAEISHSVGHIVEVSDSWFELSELPPSTFVKACPNVHPENAAFILFTSGSTGTPKGIVHTHSTVASSLHAHGNAMDIGTNSRTLQFSAFVFDVSITEIFMSLTRGGVLCIPSDNERMNDLESAITRMNANWAHLTPTVASLLKPANVPTLKHMALAGEPLKKTNVAEWASVLELVNLYGPAECCLATTLRVGLVPEDRPDNIGRAAGLLVWIVDPLDVNRLVPVGGVGEVLLEGPNVAREYLRDKERTLASFIENPDWLKDERRTPPRRFYKSGDLARYNGDGSIQILGRIDTQVKLHGQRVELGEIEYQMKVDLSSHDLVNLAVIYAKSANFVGGGLLAAFVEFEEKSDDVRDDQVMLTIPGRLKKILVNLSVHLNDTVPSYMVPSVYVPLNAMPLLTAGKIDRKRLTEVVQRLTIEQISLYSLSEFQAEKIKPRTKMERRLHQLWARTLNVDSSSIGVDDNFFRLGGDSVGAMKLAAAGREVGITITVNSIFQNSKLSDMAKVASILSDQTLEELETRHGIARKIVQDVYACTPLQEGMMLLSTRYPEAYVVQHILRLKNATNVEVFRKAWETVFKRTPILRTRIVHLGNTTGSIQVVLDEPICWENGTSLPNYLIKDKALAMRYAERLVRFAIVHDITENATYFVLTAHHSIFDSNSVELLMSELALIYDSLCLNGQDLADSSLTSYKFFAEQVSEMDISAAESFWRNQFADMSFSTFPKLPSGHHPLATSSIRHNMGIPPGAKETESISIGLRAAWALLMAQYSDTPDNVVFGMTLSGREVIDGGDKVMGPTIATIPFKIGFTPGQTLEHFVGSVYQQDLSSRDFQHFGLQNIKMLGPDASKACNFQSLLAIYSSARDGPSLLDHICDPVQVRDSPTTYLLSAECHIGEDSIEVKGSYDPHIISLSLMQRILQQYSHIFSQVMTPELSKDMLADLDCYSPEDAKDVFSWNQNIPKLAKTCVHEVITRHHLDSQAVSSWDGDLTYRELDALSTRLAHHLVKNFLIGPESLVPLCFSKSIWVVIAMIAVLKAGAGYVPMDPKHPAARLQEIVDAAKAGIILCSPEYEVLARSLGKKTFAVLPKTVEMCKEYSGPPCATVTSQNTCYVIFTSGSTGKPKGVVMEHGAFSTAATEQGRRLNLNDRSRVIHFSSYAFEACILEILTTLYNGGCVCISPESQRLEDITETMRSLKANWAFFTPSFIRTINPDQVPGLKTLVLGGEALGADNIDMWVDKVQLVNGYGPSETCVFSVVNESVRRGDTPDLIGSAIGGACWIVNPDDHSKLVPVGCVGELLIEGPTLARGYLDDVAKTDAVFVDNSKLISNIRRSMGKTTNGTNGVSSNGYKNGSATHESTSIINGYCSGKRMMYKTGDLVRYDTMKSANGAIRFVGRKDTQVKVRGQRMELGDIEYHLKSNLHGAQHISVDQIILPSRETAYLIAFFSLKNAGSSGTVSSNAKALLMTLDLKQSIAHAEENLTQKLPAYMIPTLYVQLSTMPLLSSGKTNRRALRHLASQLSDDQIAHYSLVDGVKRTSSDDKVIRLTKLWIETLHLGAGTIIGLDDNFFRLGGDSISAMKLTSISRENGLLLSVGQIFTSPRLEDMAAAVTWLSNGDNIELKPFELLHESGSVENILNHISKQYQIAQSAIEDIFPCSPLQEGLMLLSFKHPGSYMSQITLSLSPEVDIDRFKAAWAFTIEKNTVLRTRFTHSISQTLQFVVKGDIKWRGGSNLERYLDTDKQEQMNYGQPLARYAIIESDTERNFVLTAHHSLYDGWSLMLVMQDLNRVFRGQKDIVAPPYSTFIKHLISVDLDAAKSFWQSQFANKSLASFPEPYTVTQAPVETQIIRYTNIKRPFGSDITLSTVLRAAWALLTARYANTEDVFFGVTLMGRNASLPNIERMTGPTITTVPLCVSINRNEPILSYLRRVQNQGADMIPYEHTGLQQIKRFGVEAETACTFQNLLVVQPEGSEDLQSELWKEKVLFAKGEMVTMTYALILECRLYKDKVRLTAQYREHITPTPQMERMLAQLEHVIHELNNATSDSQTVHDIEMISKQDKQEISHWSGKQVVAVDDCIHHVISRQIESQPNSAAVDAWDKSLTYAELDVLATKLAHHLKSRGVGPGVYVPLCFDKSAWTIVAIIAVLKAGGAYLSLDPKHPLSRKEHIIRDVNAKVVITGKEYQNMFHASQCTVIALDEKLMLALSESSLTSLELGTSSNAAFVVFTSGSTGVPKGIVMEHGPFVSSARSHSKALCIDSKSRVLQFAAYTYDVSMGEILTTLMQGGCVCIPSEEERLSNLAGAINSFNVNWTFLTPTVAGFLDPSKVPGLKTLVLGGEHATSMNIKTWSEKVHLINSYGPAECAIWCACAPGVTLDADPASLGHAVGAKLWIVDYANPDNLSPIGCVGELVVEGPTLAREYLNDPQKTAKAFIENPKWASDGSNRARRMYRTGDLVRYGNAGDILFVGRRDTQAKLHGQRIELGEIEHHLNRNSPSTWLPVVEILTFPEDDRDVILAAFIHVNEAVQGQDDRVTLPVTDDMLETLNHLRSKLEQDLPSHMIPAAYIPLSQLPLTAGGKVDRKSLRKIGESLEKEQILSFLLNSKGSLRQPSTKMEQKLQQLWARVLSIQPDSIGLDSHFLRVGGDSVAAMRLSAASRDSGLLLSVKNVFTFPTLETMSKATAPISEAQETGKIYAPFSSLHQSSLKEVMKVVTHYSSTVEGAVEDVMHATDYQRWVLGCGQLKSRGYNNYFIFHLEGDLDLQRLRNACRALLKHHSVLRTIFVPHKSSLFQVVLKEVEPEFTVYDNSATQKILETDIQRPVSLEHPSVRFFVLKSKEKDYELFMRASHAQYDGISLPNIVQDLKAGYMGQNFSASFPFSKFVSGTLQTLDLEDAERFWRKELAESKMTQVVEHKSPLFGNPVNRSLKRVLSVDGAANPEATFATIIKASWSLVLAQLSGTSDVVFGQISTGRNAPISGINEVVGPCMNLIPVRVKVNAAKTCAELLQMIQKQHLNMSTYESLGFQRMIDNCTSWPKWTRFSSILQHTAFNVGMDSTDSWGDVTMKLGNFTPEHDVSDVWIWTGPVAGGYSVEFTYSSNTMPESVARESLDMLCNNILALSAHPERLVDQLISQGTTYFPLASVAPEGSHSLPEPVEPDTSKFHRAESIVRAAWENVFDDKHDLSSSDFTPATPYFELRGDLLVAAQLSRELNRLLSDSVLSPEDVIQNPTIKSQVTIILSKM
ncbi:hypothetical protein PVAG01_05832 [Phlyctema vagabunda]|uniref:Carrier domain-containing protein n=1 Tax=Phlyctema vagabunda TaxID=108571 RepID=A0ABR4PEC4_9HELO